ncbi:MAG: menaquinone biosynthesis protein [Nitrospiraceae bacterium]|nr:menaquinone biosynthesis protein [Nitrospiraceae bacterium]
MTDIVEPAENRLRIGEIFYSNLFPIFYMLKKNCDCALYEFIHGVPSDLNKMVRNGEIDISPSSSIEYLRMRDEYEFIENHSISSIGAIGSIFLYSRRPIEKLNGMKILTSSQSETSTALLEIIFRKFLKINCNSEPGNISIESLIYGYNKAEAYMLIGDDAMKAVRKYESSCRGPELYIYDLGELWHKYTELPFTFALWIYKKNLSPEKQSLIKKLRKDLDAAKLLALKNFGLVADNFPLKEVLGGKEIVDYWENISYDFNDEHKKGLELFCQLSGELGLIKHRIDS